MSALASHTNSNLFGEKNALLLGRRVLWESQIEQMARDAVVKRLATEKLDDNNDMVKLINSLGASAAAFMIRDEQVTMEENMLVGYILECARSTDVCEGQRRTKKKCIHI